MSAVPMGLGYPPCETAGNEPAEPAEVICVHEADWGCGEYVTRDHTCSRGREGCCGCCEADYSHTREVW